MPSFDQGLEIKVNLKLYPSIQTLNPYFTTPGVFLLFSDTKFHSSWSRFKIFSEGNFNHYFVHLGGDFQ